MLPTAIAVRNGSSGSQTSASERPVAAAMTAETPNWVQAL